MKANSISLEWIHATLRELAGALPAWEDRYLHLHARRYQETLALLARTLPPGSRLLDVGCFPGHIGLLAGELGFSVHGLNNIIVQRDVHTAFIERMGRSGIEIRICDVEKDLFPYEPESFDGVLACEIIEHLWMNPYHLLHEVFKVLRPGGKVIVTTPNLARIEVALALLRGRSFHPELSQPFRDVFPSILSHRHVREYTAAELLHFFEGQSVLPYLFGTEEIIYGAPYEEPLRGILRGQRGADRVFSTLGWVAKKLSPRFCSNLLAIGTRPENLLVVPVSTLVDLQGWHGVEFDRGDQPDFNAAVLVPFRWTDGNASFTIPPQEDGRIGRLLLQAGNWTPEIPGLPASNQVSIEVNGNRVLQADLPRYAGLQRLSIPLPETSSASGDLRVTIRSDAWRPRDYGLPDDRSLGVAVGWESVLAERAG